MNVIIGLAIALAVSLAGNAWLFWTVSDQREEIGAVNADKANITAAAQACSDGVADIQKQSQLQIELAQKQITAARQAATQANRRADRERNRPQAVPGDECASAAVESREWLRSRRGEQ